MSGFSIFGYAVIFELGSGPAYKPSEKSCKFGLESFGATVLVYLRGNCSGGGDYCSYGRGPLRRSSDWSVRDWRVVSLIESSSS